MRTPGITEECAHVRGVKKHRTDPADDERAPIEQDFVLGELTYELHTGAGLSSPDEVPKRLQTAVQVA